MATSIYSINNGKTMVWQRGNSRVVQTGLFSHYEVRENVKAEWREAFYGKVKQLRANVESEVNA